MTGQVRCVVTGRVQGVGFRMFVRDQAAELGLTGWVRNRVDDQAVECVAVGTSTALDEFRRRLQRGPRDAMVADVRCEDQTPAQAFKGFGIRR